MEVPRSIPKVAGSGDRKLEFPKRVGITVSLLVIFFLLTHSQYVALAGLGLAI